MEPENHPFEKEHHLPSTSIFWVRSPLVFAGPGQIIIFHQPRFPWNKGISHTKPPFGGNRSCEVGMKFDQAGVWLVSANSSYSHGLRGTSARRLACPSFFSLSLPLPSLPSLPLPSSLMLWLSIKNNILEKSNNGCGNNYLVGGFNPVEKY